MTTKIEDLGTVLQELVDVIIEYPEDIDSLAIRPAVLVLKALHARAMKQLTVEELIELAYDENLDSVDKVELVDVLASKAKQIAGAIDKINDIDPDKGKRVRYGTRNRLSCTYKVREALGYAYP